MQARPAGQGQQLEVLGQVPGLGLVSPQALEVGRALRVQQGPLALPVETVLLAQMALLVMALREPKGLAAIQGSALRLLPGAPHPLPSVVVVVPVSVRMEQPAD